MKSRTHGLKTRRAVAVEGWERFRDLWTNFPTSLDRRRSSLAVGRQVSTPAELLARSCASSPRARSKKGLMMPHLSSLTGTDCMTTLYPPTKQKHEAGNILKTKDRERAFSQNEAENILKRSQLQETIGTPKKPDKMTIGRDPRADDRRRKSPYVVS